MNEHYILAVDPGGTSGWATHERWDNAPDEDGFSSGQYEFNDFVEFVDKLAHDVQLTAIVAEKFTINQQTIRHSQQTTALEVIGFLRYIALREECPFILQTPADAKKFSTDARLDVVDWTKRPKAKWDHANDGARHLMLYMVKNKLMEPPRV